MADLNDLLHSLVDAVRFHSEQQVVDAHNIINAHAKGQTLEQYRAELVASNPQAVASEDAILEKAAQIKAQREARAAQEAQIAAAAQAQRPGTPIAVSGTPASPTADPDAN